MADLIDRKAAIEAVDIENLHRGIVEALQNIISELPSAQRWIPIKTRPMDEEERQAWSEKLGYDLDGEEAVIMPPLPDNGQEVLTCSICGLVRIDTFYEDENGCYFEENMDMDGIVAWMPLPEPYKEDMNEQTDNLM